MVGWQRIREWLAFVAEGDPTQQDPHRVIESLIPVSHLYGMDIGSIDTGLVAEHEETR